MNFIDSGKAEPAVPLGYTTPLSRDNDAAFVAFQARTTRRAEAAAEFIVVLVCAIALALLLVDWLTPCEVGQLCSLAPAWLTPARRVRAGAAPPPPPVMWAHSERERQAVEAAREEGERDGYVAGWRWGAVCGFVLGALAGGCTVAGALLLGLQA